MGNIMNVITNCRSDAEAKFDLQNKEQSSDQIADIMISPIKNNLEWLNVQSNNSSNNDLPDVIENI